MLLVALAGSWLDSRRGTKHEGSTAAAGGAESCPSLATEGLSSAVLATGLQTAAESALGTKSGFHREGPPGEECNLFPWPAWQPEEAGWSEERHSDGCWASRGPEYPVVLRNRLGSHSCLLRWRGPLLPCQRQTKSFEPTGDVVSILLELHCPWIACPLHGSICQAHEPLIMRGVCSVPKQETLSHPVKGMWSETALVIDISYHHWVVQYWRGRMCSRPRRITEEAADMRQSNLQNTLRGCAVPNLNDATPHWMFMKFLNWVYYWVTVSSSEAAGRREMWEREGRDHLHWRRRTTSEAERDTSSRSESELSQWADLLSSVTPPFLSPSSLTEEKRESGAAFIEEGGLRAEMNIKLILTHCALLNRAGVHCMRHTRGATFYTYFKQNIKMVQTSRGKPIQYLFSILWPSAIHLNVKIIIAC